MTLILLFAAGYLLGSIPVAYLLVHSNYALDLREQGSSNIGAMNSYEVTGSRGLGITIGILDALKGAAAVMLPYLISGLLPSRMFTLHSVALLGAVCGHNYNLWLSLNTGHLEGGKGLAAAAGGMLLFVPWLVPIWALLYGAGLLLFEQWKKRRDIIAGNVFAVILLPLPAYILYGLKGLMLVLALDLLILPKHSQQLRELLNR